MPGQGSSVFEVSRHIVQAITARTVNHGEIPLSATHFQTDRLENLNEMVYSKRILFEQEQKKTKKGQYCFSLKWLKGFKI